MSEGCCLVGVDDDRGIGQSASGEFSVANPLFVFNTDGKVDVSDGDDSE